MTSHPTSWRAQQAAAVRDAVAANLTWVGVCEGSVAGFVNVILRPDDASGEIYMIAVDPTFQRRGVAVRIDGLHSVAQRALRAASRLGMTALQ